MDHIEIRKALKAAGIRQVQLANALGITPVKVSLSLSGQRRFTIEEMDVIRQMLQPEHQPELPAARLLPVIGQVVASKWERAVQQTTRHMPVPDPTIPSRAFALDVDGDSMDKYVQDGGRVIVDPDDKDLYPKRFYVVQNGSGETTFKRFFADPARLEPCSNNPAHKPLLLGAGETFTIVGRVIWRASRMPDDD